MQEVTEFFHLEAPDIIRMMRSADTSGDGKIDYTEFMTAAFKKQTLVQEENLKKAFEIFDSDGDGQISLEELKSGFGGTEVSQGSDQSSQEQLWENILAEADANGDGKISFDEFRAHMQSVQDLRASFADAGSAGSASNRPSQ